MAASVLIGMRKLLSHFFDRRKTVEVDAMSRYLEGVRGVIHVGANKGQERYLYDQLGLDVLWIEPIPEICRKLQRNIARFPKQKVFEALLLDADGRDVVLHVASNGGASSSVFDFSAHKKFWPEISFTHDIKLKSKKLSTVIGEEKIDLALFDALIIDTQGSELLILQGCEEILRSFRFIQVEAPDFEAYQGAATKEQIENFLQRAGFRFHAMRRSDVDEGRKAYFDLVFERA